MTWAFTSHEDLTSTNVPADAFLTTNFSYGSNLAAPTTFNTSGCKAGWAAQTLVYFKPKVTVPKNAADAAENMLEWTITPATGITFTPSSVSITACTAGGTGDPQVTIYAIYSDDTQETVQSITNPRRPDKTEQGDGPSVYSKTLTSAKSGTFKVRLYFAGLTNTSKGAAVTNIVVTGNVNGTPVATTTYTITAATNDASLGSATGTATVVENEEVTLTAIPTTAGKFTKWQKDGEDFTGNTANPLTVTATADATYTAIFEALPKISFDKGEGTGTTPAVAYVEKGTAYTLPFGFFLIKEGATLTGWNDGTNTYAPGASYTVNDDVTFAAVFTDNTVSLGSAETTVNWTFATKDGAPTIACEGSELDYVQQVKIGSTPLDVVMHINTNQDAGISGKKGKVNNTSGDNRAQVNAGTVFTIPAIDGMVVTITATNTGDASESSVKFDGNDADSYENGVLTYTYNGTANTIDLIDQGNALYPSGIVVTYPSTLNWAKPTIAVGDFNFENKGYKVTITGVGTLMVAENDGDYAAQTSPYVTYATATTTYKAKSTGAGKEDSEVVEEEVANTFDSSKKYVAWVYESNYKNAPNNYAIADDEIYKALGANYNVVGVDIKDYISAITTEQSTALNGNMENADLVVISEAVTGKSKGVIALKDIVGSVPVLSMKFFSYSSGRWEWGTPKNADKAVVAITPVSKLYKVLDGVTFTDDNVALFDYPNEQNHIQYIESWSAEPDGDAILAKTGEYTAMHASTSKKFFGLGLSCDDFTKYNANAITIVKNAAAMLIAGEALDMKVMKVTEAGYATIVTEEATDFAAMGIEAYKAKVSDSKTSVELTAVTAAPAATPLVIAAAEGLYEIKTATSPAAVEDNDLVAGPVTGDGASHYVLGMEGTKVGFGLLKSGVVLPSTKAYIAASKLTNAPFFEIVINGDVTGVKAIENDELRIENVYDLQGRRVANPTKGLYIVNGRKVAIK